MMRLFALLIGAILSCTAVQAHAMESNSFILKDDGGNLEEGKPAASTNYQITDAGLTWTQLPAESTNYQLAVRPFIASSSSSPDATSSSEVASQPTGGGRGDRTQPGPIEELQSSSSAQSVSRHSIVSSVSTSGAPTVTLQSSVATPQGTIAATVVPEAPSGTSAPSAMHVREQSQQEFLHSAAMTLGELPLKPVPIAAIAVIVTFFVKLWRLFFAQGLRKTLQGIFRSLLNSCIGLCKNVAPDMPFFALIPMGATLERKKKQKGEGPWTTHEKAYWIAVLFVILVVMVLFFTPAAYAQDIASTRTYNGYLSNASGDPITTPVTIRFSYWKSADFVAGDTTGTGAIHSGASNYLSWYEEHTVTPSANGSFSVILGQTNALPDPAILAPDVLNSLYLQVEVKAENSGDSSYELLDIDTDDAANDRSKITSVTFARNADMVDQRSTGTSSGSIPVLEFGGLLNSSFIPSGMTGDSFTIDNDNSSSGDITLQFGSTLAKKLTFDTVNDRFNFNDDVHIEGSLSVDGLINGVDLNALAGTTDVHLKVSSGAGLTVNVAGGGYRLQGNVTQYSGSSSVLVADDTTTYVYFGSGGLSRSTAGYPTNESYIPLATVTTSGGSVTDVEDQRVLSSDDREHLVEQFLHPEFQSVSYQGDASDNVGQMYVDHDTITQRNFYRWTSTKSTLQDYDVFVRVSLPSTFVRWKDTPIIFNYRTTSASTDDNKVEISIFDTNGSPVSLSGSTANLANTSWTPTPIDFNGTPTWTAGQDFLVKFKVYAKDEKQAHIGSLKLQYVELIAP